MPEAIWIDRDDELPALARKLEAQAWIGVDTEFLRERTFFPKLCLLQLTAAGQIWLIDTLRISSLDPLMPALTAAHARKVIHSARQDLEAVYLSTKRVISPVFDTQIACRLHRPEAAGRLRGTGQDPPGCDHSQRPMTRTDWSKRPLTRAQLDYAADDVLYLGDVADHLSLRLKELGRESWALEDCLELEDKQLYGARSFAGMGAAARTRAACAGVPRACESNGGLAPKTGARPRSAARLDSLGCGDLLRGARKKPPRRRSTTASPRASRMPSKRRRTTCWTRNPVKTRAPRSEQEGRHRALEQNRRCPRGRTPGERGRFPRRAAS